MGSKNSRSSTRKYENRDLDVDTSALALTDDRISSNSSEGDFRDCRSETILTNEWLDPKLEVDQDELQESFRAALMGHDMFLLDALSDHGKLDINFKHPEFKPSLHLALQYGFIEGIDALLKHPDTDVNQTDHTSNHITFLEAVVQCWDVRVVRNILNHRKLDANQCTHVLFEVMKLTTRMPQSPSRNVMFETFIKSNLCHP